MAKILILILSCLGLAASLLVTFALVQLNKLQKTAQNFAEKFASLEEEEEEVSGIEEVNRELKESD